MLTYIVRAWAYGLVWRHTVEALSDLDACAEILAHYALPRDTVTVARSVLS